jgi:hypothetical protein
MPKSVRVKRNPLIPPDPPANPSVVWTQKTITSGPPFNGFLSLHWDHVSQQVLVYCMIAGASGIHSTDIWAYATGTNVWTHLLGTGSLSNLCADGGGSVPPDRHPYQQMAIDDFHDVLWLAGGVCAGAEPNDLWKLALNADPTDDTWTAVSIPAFPTMEKAGAMVYCPDPGGASPGVLLLLGPNGGTFWELWVLGPNAGALTANQLAAGCVNPNEWAELTPSGMPASAHSQGPQAFYDRTLEETIIFAGLHGSGGSYGGIRAIHRYNPWTQVWSERVFTGMPTETASGSAEMPVFQITSGTYAGQYLYQQTSHTTASSASPPVAYLIDVILQTFTALSSTGTGPARLCFGVWDPLEEVGVAWSYAAGSVLNIWHVAVVAP